jgi:hypothetical protein
MANHPLNLALRFFLELLGLYAMGYWGWTQHTGLPRYLWAIGLPLVAAVMWGTFRVPGHPGPAPVPVPGLLRLILEGVFFGVAVSAFYSAGRESWALAFGGIVLFHYLLSANYVAELLRS